MEEIELQKKQDERKMDDSTENLGIASTTNIATKQKIKHQLYGKNVVKAKM